MRLSGIAKPTAAFLNADEKKNCLVEPCCLTFNISANEERSTTGSLWTGEMSELALR